ncbi:MAG TPA: hypothetical protein VE955_03845, partial [Candidatus Dormibacteraeota bacterium]|nr:hypothetical protein [Candidatus Dormibacteraeota bacterium]
MLPKAGPIGSAILEGFLFVTVVALLPHAGILPHPASACPNCWVGSDDGEFDQCFGSSCYPSYVWVDESITTSMAWNSYGCTLGANLTR